MPRFFISRESIQGGRILLGEQNSTHLKALRLRAGEELTVSDGQGTEYRCAFEGMENGIGVAGILGTAPCETEPRLSVSLYAAMPKGDKAELILQKAVELGASEAFFFLSSRCVSRPEEKAAIKRMERLARVAEEAAMQSGRGRIPQVHWLQDFRAMTESAAAHALGLFLWEAERERSIRTVLQQADVSHLPSLAIVTGPEGGFSREEAEAAGNAGLTPVTLGKRILRCETAPICALSAVMYETGNLE